MREKSPIKQGLRRPTLGSTYPGSSASSSSERAALILISSSSASATSSRFRVLDFECGSYNIVGGGKVGEEPDIMWHPRRATRPPPPSNSLVYSWAATSPHSPAGPHLFGFVNTTELPSYLHRDRGRAWKWILGLGKEKTISKEARVDDPDPCTRKAQGDLPATFSGPRLTPDTLR